MSKAIVSYNNESPYKKLINQAVRNRHYRPKKLCDINKLYEDAEKKSRIKRNELVLEKLLQKSGKSISHKHGFSVMKKSYQPKNLCEIQLPKAVRKYKINQQQLKRLLHINGQYMENSQHLISVKRKRTSCTGKLMRCYFLDLVTRFEKNNNIVIGDLTKDDLLYMCKNHFDKTATMFNLKDDCSTFIPSRFICCDELQLYMYALIAPRILEFELANELPVFKSEYIENNFKKILVTHDYLMSSMVCDALLKSVNKLIVNNVPNKIKVAAQVEWDWKDSSDKDILDLINQGVSYKGSTDYRLELLKILKPNLYFYALYYKNLIENEDGFKDSKNLFSLFSLTLLNDSDRLYKSLSIMSNISDKIELDNIKGFEKLICMYNLNKHTQMLNHEMMVSVPSFKPYLIDGLLTQFFLAETIKLNADYLNSKADKFIDMASKTDMISLHNTYDNLMDNITSKDMCLLNFVIDRTSKMLDDYYFNVEKSASNCKTILKKINEDLTDEFTDLVVWPKSVNLDINIMKEIRDYFYPFALTTENEPDIDS